MVVNNFLNIIFFVIKLLSNIIYLNYNKSLHNNVSKNCYVSTFHINYFFRKFFFLKSLENINQNKFFVLNTYLNLNRNQSDKNITLIKKNIKLVWTDTAKLYSKIFSYKNINLNKISNINKIYQVSSFIQFFLKKNFNMINMLFLRKFRVFNKGRYSRNRQFYRTGVYWCLYINIIAVIGIYFWFYKITINYNYFWIVIYLFFVSFIWSRFINFFSFSKLNQFLNWNLNILTSLKYLIVGIFNKGFRKLKLFFFMI